MKPNKMDHEIVDAVADTLFIPLLMRKRETERPNPFFVDPLASALVARIDYDFERYRGARQSSVGVGLRARYFDEQAAAFIREHTHPVVVQIGCGLDTRWSRIGEDLAAKACFYELDLPEVINLRCKVLPETPRDRHVSVSMFETFWMDELRLAHPRSSFLFIAEGVFMYFEKEAVRGVLENLAERFPGSMVLFDMVSSWMCRNAHRHDTVRLASATFRLGCDRDRDLEEWSEKLSFVSSRVMADFPEWRRAGLFFWLAMKGVPWFRKASRMLLYRLG